MNALIVPTILIILEQMLLGVNGYPSFQTLIPNGNKVPNPCNPDTYWPGVGHELIGGSGVRNAFGLDFFNNSKTWTKALCEKDSDGDGIKNGIELGDPDCTWSPNSVPKFSANLSHPGVCEPMTSHQCMGKNTWLTCPKNFSCPDFQKNSTQSMDLVLPNTTVPAKETTYMCYGFKMPNDTKYHAIGLTPHIVNKEIMHHMLVLGCKQPPPDGMLDEPKECVMGIQECQTIIGLWSVGIDGECHPDQYGFPIGVSGYQYAVVQLHWNNPQLKPGMMDSSGVTLYYTDQLRPNDAMVFMVGQQVLEIPPQQQSVTYSGTCRESCTRYLPSNKTRIPAAVLHMHLLGKSGTIELLRDGNVSRILVNQTTYDYNTPVTFTYDPPVEFRAGDELKVTCDYQSMNKNKTVYWGEGTQDEMCYGFITIYPAVVGFDFCSEFVDIFVCSLPQFNVYAENDCMMSDFSSLLEPIAKTCLFGNCSKVCKVLMKGLEATGCMRKSMWNFNKQFLPMFSPGFKAMLPLLENCWEALLNDYNQSSTIKSDTWSTTSYFNENHSSSTSSIRTETTSGPGHTPGCSNVIGSSISIQSGSAIYTSLIGLLLNAWFHLIHSNIQ